MGFFNGIVLKPVSVVAIPSTFQIVIMASLLFSVTLQTEAYAQQQTIHLPASLTSVTPMEITPEIKMSGGRDFARGQLRIVDKACAAAAYPYLRTKLYWEDIQAALGALNEIGAQTSANVEIEEFTLKSVGGICSSWTKTNELLERFSAVDENFGNRFTTLCSSLGEEARRLYKPDSRKLSLPAAACVNLEHIRKTEKNICLRNSERKGFHTPRMTPEKYCNCIAERKIAYLESGKLHLNPSILIKVAQATWDYCDNLSDYKKREQFLFGGIFDEIQ